MVKLRGNHQWTPARALFDPGSDAHLLHPKLAGDLDTLLPGPALKCVWGEQKKAYGIKMKLVELVDDWGVMRREKLLFIVADIEEEMILGRDWFRKVDPFISWMYDHWNYPLDETSIRFTRSAKEARRYQKEAKYVIFLAQSIGKDAEPRVRRVKLGSDAALEEDGSRKAQVLDLPPEYEDYADVFSVNKAAEVAPLDGKAEHAIEFQDGKVPTWGPIYSLAARELEILREYIDKALKKGWIRRSSSPTGAPVLFVPKKGGELRLCVDYRKVNELTKKDRTPLPLMSEIMDRVEGAKIFTKLDLKDAYHRIRIREGDEWKTAFRCRYGHYEYLVMPFGLANAPATFQRYIHEALDGLLDTVCVAYLDDILIYSRDVKEHVKHVRSVLARLKKWKLFANPKKCQFHTESTTFLGHQISPYGIRIDRERIAAVAEWKTPRTVKEVQSFLGYTNFCRRYIKNYSKIASPLTEETKGGKKGNIVLSAAAKAAFETLKEKFCAAPLLAHFDPHAQTRVISDASDFAIGAQLEQLQRDEWHPVAYLSRKLQGPELNYSTPDAELLAITEAFKVWRHYLIFANPHVLVLTDHLNHTFFASKTKLNSRQAGALDALAPFDLRFSIGRGRTTRPMPCPEGQNGTSRRTSRPPGWASFQIFKDGSSRSRN